MKKFAVFAAVAGLSMASSMVAAEQYVQVQVGQASTDAMDDTCDYVDFIESMGIAGSCDDKDNGFRLSYGFVFNDVFAIEGGYQDIASLKANLHNDVDYEDWKADATGLDVTAVARWQLADDFRLVGRVGLLRWDVDASHKSSFGDNESASETGTSFTYGVGAEYSFLSLSYEILPNIGDDNSTGEGDFKRISLGAKFSF